jgi:hypothetical protein
MVTACGGGSSSANDIVVSPPVAVVSLPTVVPSGYPTPRDEPGQIVTGTKFVYFNAMSNSALGNVNAIDYSLVFDVIAPSKYIDFKPTLKPGEATTIYIPDNLCKQGRFSLEIRSEPAMNRQIDEIAISCGQTVYCKQTVITVPGNNVAPTIYVPSPLIHSCVVS